MKLAVNILGPLSDDKVVISEKKITNNQLHEKFYLTDKNKADEFVKQRKNLEKMDNWQKALSLGLSVTAGLFIGTNVKNFGAFGKVITSVLSSIGAMSLLSNMDKSLDKYALQQYLKKSGTKEVSKQELSELSQSKENSYDDIETQADKKPESDK